ncbi:MAG: PPOX class F420-dependent oxidoreductase [Thermoleophilia bacterium]
MASFSDKERAFFTAPNIVHLATVGADGGPNVSAVWVDIDGDDLLVNTAEGRTKADDLHRDSRVAISVVNPENAYEQVWLRGQVVEVTSEGADAHINKMAKKYLGQDVYPFSAPGEVRVMARIRPTQIKSLFM